MIDTLNDRGIVSDIGNKPSKGGVMRKITPEKLALKLWAEIIGGLIGDMDNDIKFIKEKTELLRN